MRFLPLLLIILIPEIIVAQQKSAPGGGIARGVVKDSINHYGLAAVTITIYKKRDSSLVNYQLTNEQGEFSFTGLPLSTPVIFNFTFSGYKSFSKTVTIDSSSRVVDFKTVWLTRNYGTLDAVVVEVPVPIKMNGDTLEINPAAFRLDSNAVVEDMLRRVPGMTIWGDGSITINGKPINKVYVDGKPFFGGDPAVATQNLPKNAIDKIQVYQEIDYTSDDVDQNPEDSLLTMNIKLKESKKMGFFGKAGAGVGTDNRFESDLTIQGFNKRTRIGLLGIGNNINKSGDMQSIVRQSTYRNFNPKNRYVANFGGSGINKILMGGLTFQHDFSELGTSRLNNQLNAGYNIRQNENDVFTQTNSQQSATGVAFINESKTQSNSSTLTHSANVGYNKRDRSRDFSMSADFTKTFSDASSKNNQNSSTEDVGLVSTNEQTNTSHAESQNFGFTAGYRNKDDDERDLKSFNISYTMNYSDNTSQRKNVTDFSSIADPSKSNYFDRHYHNTGSNFNNNLNMGYNALKRLLFREFNFWDINMVFSNNLSWQKSTANNAASDLDTLTQQFSKNNYLTNRNDVVRITEKPNLRFSRNFTKTLSDRFSRYINVSANIALQYQSEQNSSTISYRNLNRNFSFFLPGMQVRYNYRKFRRYEISMNINQSNSAGIPGIDQLYPIIDSTNQYSFALGNPNLKPYYNNAISFDFNYKKQKNIEKSDLNFGFNFTARQTRNGITDSSNYHSNGSRDVYLINIEKGQKSLNAGFNINTSFKMKENMLQLAYSISYSNNTSPNFIDGIYTLSKNNNLSNNMSVFFALGDVGTIQVSQGINFNNSLQTGKNLKSFKNTTYNTDASMNINFSKNFSLGNTLNYVTNKSTVQSAALWNAFATYRFLKNKSAEIKLSALDLLRQNHNISVIAGANNLTTTVTNGLQQFYMITLSYYPRKFNSQPAQRRRGRQN